MHDLLVLAAPLAPSWLLYSLSAGLGAVVAWTTIRVNTALVWRTNAEGYKAELERQKIEHAEQVAELNARIAKLEEQLAVQSEEIKRLQIMKDVVPVLEMSTDIKRVAEHTKNLLEGRTDMIERIDAAVGSPEARQATQEAIGQIRHLVEENDQRAAENAELFAELRKTIFPMIARIYAAVVEKGVQQ